MGGRDLDVVCLELTYGLERIAMYLQKKDSAFDLEWAKGVTWGDVSRRAEREGSAYNFEHADVDAVRAVYQASGRECSSLLDKGLVVPAHERLMDASHAFNLLDARGVIGVNQRAAMIGEIRKLARACADRWLEIRATQPGAAS
jgi:glycyl-tRNA synthetase alpha chain